MSDRPTPRRGARRTFAVLALALAAAGATVAVAADVPKGIEQALTAAMQDKRGITLYVGGQTIGGAVTKVESGQWVELKNQTMSRIVVRIDRIDAVAAP